MRWNNQKRFIQARASDTSMIGSELLIGIYSNASILNSRILYDKFQNSDKALTWFSAYLDQIE